jgi:hypothetical protein
MLDTAVGTQRLCLRVGSCPYALSSDRQCPCNSPVPSPKHAFLGRSTTGAAPTAVDAGPQEDRRMIRGHVVCMCRTLELPGISQVSFSTWATIYLCCRTQVDQHSPRISLALCICSDDVVIGNLATQYFSILRDWRWRALTLSRIISKSSLIATDFRTAHLRG